MHVAVEHASQGQNSAAQSTQLSKPYHNMYRYVRVYCCVLVFLLFSLFVVSGSSCFFLQIAPITTTDRNLGTPGSTAQHTKGNQLCAGSSWHHHVASCTKSWASYISAPFTLCCNCFLRERSGRRQPPAGRNPYI